MATRKPSTQFGVTSMGEKGQVVIPAAIRSSMKLAKGEKLIVMAHEGGITFMPADHFAKVAKQFAAVEKIAERAK